MACSNARAIKTTCQELRWPKFVAEQETARRYNEGRRKEPRPPGVERRPILHRNRRNPSNAALPVRESLPAMRRRRGPQLVQRSGKTRSLAER
jgi:hypothetical protein